MLEIPGTPPLAPTRTTGRLNWGSPWMPPATHRNQIDVLYLLIAAIMVFVGMFFFGWRGLLSAATAALAALSSYLLAALLTHLVRPKRLPDSSLHVLGMGLLLGACLPVLRQPMVPILAGLVMGLAAHVVGRSHRVRVHPVAVALVLVWLLPDYLGASGIWPERLADLQAEPAVLRLGHMFTGNLYNSSRPAHPGAWWDDDLPFYYDAMIRPQPAAVLMTNRQDILADGSLLADKITRGQICRIEEILIGCIPGPVGGSSRALIILLGFYLMYRRLTWWPMPLAAVAAALATFLLMPVHAGGHWTLVVSRLVAMGPALGFIFTGYVMLASPLLLVTLILAPPGAPMSAGGKIIYGMVLGAGVILIQWAVPLPESGYASLLVAGLLARPLDALQRSPFVK